ncbi:MAG: extracellular solute-binding protein [Treponema sp.]|jgi:lactose/L-arabinose transport system substrate-binding protein|nr:extracellular solute-binding protein [Treponema sp.]
MKKIGISLLIAVLIFTLFAACQKQEAASQTSGAQAGERAANAPDAPVTLTVWCWDPAFNIYAMNEAAKIYNRDKPNVTINVVETPWDDVQQKLITSLESGQTDNLPDIILMQDNAIQKNITIYPDAFLPLNGKVDLSEFAQFKLDFGNYKGKNYGVPFDNGATGFFLRKDIIEQAGLQVSDFNDTTWEKIIELGKIVKQKTNIPLLSTVANSPDYIMLMLQSTGSWFFKPDGSLDIKDNAVLKKGIELMGEMRAANILTLVADWNAYIATLNTGGVAGTIQGCWIIGSISAEQSQSGQWAMVSTPRFETIPGAVNYSSQGGSGWMVLANSKNPDVAMDLLNKTFAGSVEFYSTILVSSGAIATWLPAGQSPTYGEPVAYFGGQKIYADLLSYAEKIPLVKYGVYNYEARDAVGRAISDIMNGKNIDAALATAQQEVEHIINE